MAKIGSIYVDISANSAKFSKELKKTSKQAKGWGASVKATVGKAAGVFAIVTAAVTATAAAVFGLYSRQAEYIDGLAKQASQLNTLVADLQAVKSAADFAGVGEGIEKAMQRLSRGLGDAAKGTGEALKAVKELGLNAAELASKTATEQLEAVLDKLQEIPPGAERVALAFQFFGRSGVGLVNLTSDAISQARDELDRWGVSITEQEAAWVEATNDNISRLGKFASAAGIQFSTKLAPMIGAASEGLLRLAEDTIDWGQITDFAVSAITKAWLGLRVYFDSVRLVFSGLKIAFAEFAVYVIEKIQPLQAAVIDLYNMLPGDDIDPSSSGVARTLDYLNQSIEENRESAKKLAQDLKTVWDDGLDGSVYAKTYDSTIEDVKRRAEEARKTQIALQSSLAAGMGASNDPMFSPVSGIGSAGKELAAAERARQKKLAADARAAAKAAADATKAEQAAIAAEIKAVNGEIETFANRLGQGIAESATRGSDAVREMVADMLIQLAKVKLQQAFTAGGGGESSGGGFLSNLLGGLFSNAVAPTGAGAAATSLSAGSSASGYNAQTINVFASGESSSSVAQTRSAVRSLTEASPQQVASRAQRGGSYAQSMGGR